MPSDKSNSPNLSIEDLLDQFSSSSLRKQKTLIASIETRSKDLLEIQNAGLNSFDPDGDDWGAGSILQILYRKHPDYLKSILEKKPEGWFNLFSDQGLNYEPLQKSLLEQDFEEADLLTNSFLRQLAGKEAVQRGYVYFSEVANISTDDLVTIDRLWIAYSQAKFGLSIQGRLLDSLGGKYELLWPRIGWKKDGVWTRYPNSFKWSLEAPDGHMPAINQLRGVRLLDSLINHPGIKTRR